MSRYNHQNHIMLSIRQEDVEQGFDPHIKIKLIGWTPDMHTLLIWQLLKAFAIVSLKLCSIHQQNPLCSRETVYSGGSGEMDLLPESSRGLWRGRPSAGGSGETDLPPEPPEKQTFLWSLQRTFSKPCFPL